jgi:DNA-binding NtrC family response regulator
MVEYLKYGKHLLGMKKVLLLDDDSAQLSVRQLLLERMGGIESQIATQAETALEMLRSDVGKDSIGVVVTDHVMPDMDGPEFVREVRAFDPHIPVIVVSGLPDADAAYEGLNVRFLMKPCEPSDLITMIRSELDGQRPRASA